LGVLDFLLKESSSKAASLRWQRHHCFGHVSSIFGWHVHWLHFSGGSIVLLVQQYLCLGGSVFILDHWAALVWALLFFWWKSLEVASLLVGWSHPCFGCGRRYFGVAGLLVAIFWEQCCVTCPAMSLFGGWHLHFGVV
jgi:hypothetical protein